MSKGVMSCCSRRPPPLRTEGPYFFTPKSLMCKSRL